LKQARTNNGNWRKAISGALNKFREATPRICLNGSARRRNRRSRTEKVKPYLMVLFIGWIMMFSDSVGPAQQNLRLRVLDIIRNTRLFRRFL
jgi:hypothetical protein